MNDKKQRRLNDASQPEPGSPEAERRRKQALAAGLAGAGAVGAAAGAGAVLAGQEILEKRDNNGGEDPSVQAGDGQSLDVFDAPTRDAHPQPVIGPPAANVTTPSTGREDDAPDAGLDVLDVFEERSTVIGRRPMAQTRSGETRSEPVTNVGESATVIAASSSGTDLAPPVTLVTPQPATPQAPDPVVQSGTGSQPSTSLQPALPASPSGAAPVVGEVSMDSPSNGSPPVAPAPVVSPSPDTSSDSVSAEQSAPSGPVEIPDDTSSSAPANGSGNQPSSEEQSGHVEDHDHGQPPMHPDTDDEPDYGDAQPAPDYGQDMDYDYPRVIAYNAAHGTVQVAINEDGFILEYHEDGSVNRIDEHGNQHPWSFVPEQAVTLLDVDMHGNARFERADGTIYELDTHGNYELVYEPDEQPIEDAPPIVEDEIEDEEPPEQIDDAPPADEAESDVEAGGLDLVDRGDFAPGDLQPIDSVIDLFGPQYEYLPAGAPEVFEYNGESYPNPEVDESFTYQYSTQAGAHYYQDANGYTIVIMPNDGGTTTMLWGNPAANDGSWDMQMTIQADGQYAPIEAFEVEPEAPPEYEYLPDGVPEAFEYNGETYPNPELDEGYTYQYSTEAGAHYYQNESGHTIVVVENDDGTTTMLWGNPQANNGEWDMSMIVQPDGQYAPTEAFEATPVDTQEFIVGTINPALLGTGEGYLPEGMPDYFVSENYPNPETDESYELVSSETTPNGLGTHRYADAEGNTITVSTSDGQPVQIAWADSDGNQNLVVSFDAEGEWTPSLYNPDEYTPPGQAATDTEPESGPAAEDDPEDEPGLGYGLIEDPRYPHGVASDEVFLSGLPDADFRTHVEQVGWVLEEDIDYDEHTFLPPFGLVRNDFLEDHIWNGVAWVAKDDIEEGVDDFFFEGPGTPFVTDIQLQTAADPEDAPQVGELPTGPELTVPETPSIVPAEEEEAALATEAVSEPVTPAVTYPLVLDWGAGMEGGWVRVAQADGNTYEYHTGDATTYLVTNSGVVATNTPAPSLMHVGNDGTATFQHSSGSFYFQWNTSGGQIEVAEGALPFAVGEPYVEPVPEQAQPESVDEQYVEPVTEQPQPEAVDEPYVEPVTERPPPQAEEEAPQVEPVSEALLDFEVNEDVGADTTSEVQPAVVTELEPETLQVEAVDETAVPMAVVEQPDMEMELEPVETDLDDDDGMP